MILSQIDKLENHPKRDFLELIISYADEIYEELGSGFSESVYHKAFEILLRQYHIPYESQTIIPVLFRNNNIGFIKSDIIIKRQRDDSKCCVIELKATVNEPKKHEITQINNYMKYLNVELGIIINFPQSSICKYTNTDIDFVIVDFNNL